MNQRKIETPENFVYARREGEAWRAGGEPLEPRLEEHAPGLFRYSARAARWPRAGGSQAGLSAAGIGRGGSADGAVAGGAVARCAIGEGGAPRLELGGVELLAPLPGKGLGVCGKKWILAFRLDPGTDFHGMGEKNFGVELSGRRTRFWNTDLFADFEWSAVGEARADPLYVSLPVLWIRREGAWAVLVLDNPAAPFMNTGAGEGIFAAGSTPFEASLNLGARDGAPELWILAGRDPLELARRLQTLQGRTPLPPLWALGHHQCRWGYRDFDAVEEVARGYEERRIPNDGIWLDIDSMDGFRVFTTDPARYAEPEARIASLARRGFRVVPILDPGIRRDPGFPVYRAAREEGVLCRTPEGADYVGFVWPGYAVFPDFSLPEGRAFWARQVERYARLGFAGFWIDMNDPSTGSAPLEDMLFSRGKLPHEEYHNQYANGMAEATRAGLEAARPGERPFVISRSAWLGMAPRAAVWTGDNVSNTAHLAASIPVSLNLSVSGLPFNGPDVPGFAGDADADLMRAWYKACFLFPFLRNHRVAGARDQEPWTRGRRVERAVRELLRSRYRLLPYLYNLFMDQEESGDPLLRPLWLVDPDPAAAGIGDQFLLGPSLLQAPVLDPRARGRRLRLPPGTWFEPARRMLHEGGRDIESSQSFGGTPLFLAAPSLLPLLGEETLRAGEARLSRIDLLAVLPEGTSAEYRYRHDDGLSSAYRDGARSEFRISVENRGGLISARGDCLSRGAGGLAFRLLLPTCLGARRFESGAAVTTGSREILALAGTRLPVLAGESIRLD